MVKQGPIPDFVHSIVEYIAGVALIAAPLLLDYHSGAAKAVSIVLGVLVLFLAATTTSTLSLIDQVPLSMHIVFDYAIVAVMIASPFLFGFSGESTPTGVFLAGGVVWLLLSIGTRYRKEETPERGARKQRRSALPTEGGERGGAAADQPSQARQSPDAVPDESIPEFKPPPAPQE
jgi:VIT1/CCC1 family predicted Fe2+/Mn2+ transporter